MASFSDEYGMEEVRKQCANHPAYHERLSFVSAIWQAETREELWQREKRVTAYVDGKLTGWVYTLQFVNFLMRNEKEGGPHEVTDIETNLPKGCRYDLTLSYVTRNYEPTDAKQLWWITTYKFNPVKRLKRHYTITHVQQCE